MLRDYPYRPDLNIAERVWVGCFEPKGIDCPEQAAPLPPPPPPLYEHLYLCSLSMLSMLSVCVLKLFLCFCRDDGLDAEGEARLQALATIGDEHGYAEEMARQAQVRAERRAQHLQHYPPVPSNLVQNG